MSEEDRYGATGENRSSRESGGDSLGSAGASSSLLVDSLGLAYAARGGRILVHYPMHDAGREGVGRYGTGFDIGPIPPSYWSDPPNDITRERAAIWRTLLESYSAASE